MKFFCLLYVLSSTEVESLHRLAVG
jgi:hypothetical protein